jgi:hypothetical protein
MKQRTYLLSIVLGLSIFTIALNLFISLYYGDSVTTVFTSFLDFSSPLIVLSNIAYLMAIAGVIGIFLWKKWAIYCLATYAVIWIINTFFWLLTNINSDSTEHSTKVLALVNTTFILVFFSLWFKAIRDNKKKFH